jgi:hypothetical protein
MIYRIKDTNEIFFDPEDFFILNKKEQEMKKQANGDKEKYSILFNEWIESLPFK